MSWEDAAGFVICLGGLNPLCWAGCSSPSEVEFEDEDTFPPPPDSYADSEHVDTYIPPDSGIDAKGKDTDGHISPDTHDAANDSDSDAEDSTELPILPDVIHQDLADEDLVLNPEITDPADAVDTKDTLQETDSGADTPQDLVDILGDTTDSTDSVEETDGTEIICVPEKCDNEDNDCDGLVDEDFAGLGNVCELGEGICYSVGYYVCSDDGAQALCDAEVIPPQEEVCDGLDNNCNGKTDEVCACIEKTYEPVTTECGEGACYSTGETSCKNGEVKDSCEPSAPLGYDDTCDGIDDDCDGLIDNGYIKTIITCGIGVCESTVQITCVNGVEDECVPGLPTFEACDGKDNDCDGATDEGCACVPGVYTPIDTTCGVGACASTGKTYCDNGVIKDKCTPKAGAPNDPTCNGVDDDCDGVKDDDYKAYQITCGIGPCEKTITTSCTNGAEDNVCTPGTPTPEICDEIDNNCNGPIDEGMADNDGDGKCNEVDCDINEPDTKYLVINCPGMPLGACWDALTSPALFPGDGVTISIDYYADNTPFQEGNGIQLCYDQFSYDKTPDPAPIACLNEIFFEVAFGGHKIWNSADYDTSLFFDKGVSSAGATVYYQNYEILFNTLSCEWL